MNWWCRLVMKILPVRLCTLLWLEPTILPCFSGKPNDKCTKPKHTEYCEGIIKLYNFWLLSIHWASTNNSISSDIRFFFNFGVPRKSKDNAEGQEVYCGLSTLHYLGWYGSNPRSSGTITDQKNQNLGKPFKRWK